MSNLTMLSQHGVMLNIAGQGVLILGQAGIGKSSLAMSLLNDDQQLIADDVVELSQQDHFLLASCPSATKGLLHHRELGLIDVEQVWGKQAIKRTQRVDAVIELVSDHTEQIDLQTDQHISFLDCSLPIIRLSIHSPCSLTSRVYIWLKNKPNQAAVVKKFKQKQQQMMQQ